MTLELKRKYYPTRVEGTLTYEGELLCYTLELPWRNNERHRSCIPQGIFSLKLRHSEKHRNHVWIKGVPNRSLILFHLGNYVVLDSEGCILPVMKITGIGIGEKSRLALDRILSLLQIHAHEINYLNITSDAHPFINFSNIES